MVATNLITAAQLAAMDEDLRVELIEGELVEMSPAGPKHAVFVSDMIELLGEYCRSTRGIRVLAGDAGYQFQRNPDTILVPDIVMVTAEQRRAMKSSDDPFALIVPLIAIEVRSPSERAAKVARKTAIYLAAGVREVWWVRPDKRQLDIHAPDHDPRTLRDGDVLESPEVLPGFRLPLTELFDL